MYTVCEKCGKKYDLEKKCPKCGCKLKTQYTEEELKKIQKQNDDMTVINTMLSTGSSIKFGRIDSRR